MCVMPVCLNAYMYTCTCSCLRTYIQVYVSASKFIDTYIRTCIHRYIHVHICKHIYIHTQSCTCLLACEQARDCTSWACTYIHAHISMVTYVHTHIHTHTHAELQLACLHVRRHEIVRRGHTCRYLQQAL